MKAALRKYAREMRNAGFDYSHPDEVEADIKARLDAPTSGGTIPIENMSPSQLGALKNLQDFEPKVAVKNCELGEEIFDSVEEAIQKEMYARKDM